MAPLVTLHEFHSVLRKLNIDISQFSDPTFDNICDESELQEFLLWIVSNFNEDNVLSDNEKVNFDALQLQKPPNKQEKAYQETIEFDHNDILADEVKSLEKRLHQAQVNLCQARCLEKKLNDQEKEAIGEYNKAREDLFQKVAKNLTDDLTESTEEAVKNCCMIEPVLPSLEAYKNADSKMDKKLESFFKTSILQFEERREIELASTFQPEIPDIENKLGKALLLRKTIERKLLEIASRFQGKDDRFESPKLKDVQSEVTREIQMKELAQLKRDLASYDYLCKTLEEYEDLYIGYLTNTMAFIAAIEERFLYAKELTNSIENFVGSMKSESDCLERAIAKLIEGSKQRGKDECDFKCEGSDMITGGGGDGFSHEKELMKPSLICKRIIEPSHRYLVCIEQLYGYMGHLLNNVRCGPTTKVSLLPMKLLITLTDCKRMRNNAKLELNKLVNLYSNMTTNLKRNSDKSKLLWVYFLTKPSQLKALLQNENNTTMMLNSTVSTQFNDTIDLLNFASASSLGLKRD